MLPNVDRLIDFLQQSSALFNTPNNEFLSQLIYEAIDLEWLQYMSQLGWDDLNRLPTEWVKFEACPVSLKNFFAEAAAVSWTTVELLLLEVSAPEYLHARRIKKIKAKKIHELVNFSHLVKKECDSLEVKRVVDIGCGLGHMLNFISNSTNIECMGIETNEQFCCIASSRYGDAIRVERLHFPSDQMGQLLSVKKRRTALISLHGCGDLQPMILREFINLQNSSDDNPLLLTIGCCYHKLTEIDASWPMSARVKQYLAVIKWRPSLSAFRLACQERMPKWKAMTKEEHEFHKQAFMNRAVVQCLYEEMGINQSTKAKVINRNLSGDSKERLEKILEGSNISDPVEVFRWKENFKRIEQDHQHAAAFIEPFTALQFALQSPLETLILWDRLLYLRENGVEAELKAIFDPIISPRNICLVGKKKEWSTENK